MTTMNILNQLILNSSFFFLNKYTFSNLSQPANVHLVPWPGPLAFLAILRKTNSSYQERVSTPIPAHSSNPIPIPLVQCVHNISWVHLVPLGTEPCGYLRYPTHAAQPPKPSNAAPWRLRVCLRRRRQVWTLSSLTICPCIRFQRHLTLISLSFLSFAVIFHSFIPWLL